MRPFFFVLVTFGWLVVSGEIFGQIQNGGFEEWNKTNQSELPINWDELLENSDSCVIKSIQSVEGSFALSLASRNLTEGFFGPAYLGTRFKPSGLNNRLSFYYLIDSLSGQSVALERDGRAASPCTGDGQGRPPGHRRTDCQR